MMLLPCPTVSESSGWVTGSRERCSGDIRAIPFPLAYLLSPFPRVEPRWSHCVWCGSTTTSQLSLILSEGQQHTGGSVHLCWAAIRSEGGVCVRVRACVFEYIWDRRHRGVEVCWWLGYNRPSWVISTFLFLHPVPPSLSVYQTKKAVHFPQLWRICFVWMLLWTLLSGCLFQEHCSTGNDLSILYSHLLLS